MAPGLLTRPAPDAPQGIHPDFWQMLWLQAGLSEGLPRWLLDHGTAFPDVRLHDQLGLPRQCFFNAGTLAINQPHLRYCEGLAASADLPLPVPHAWVVDEQGRAVETTWRKPGVAYLGAVFQPDAFFQLLEEVKIWGVFDVWTPAWVAEDTQRWKEPGFDGMGAWGAWRKGDRMSADLAPARQPAQPPAQTVDAKGFMRLG